MRKKLSDSAARRGQESGEIAHIEGDVEAKYILLEFGRTLLELGNLDCRFEGSGSV